jgi:hypothetical protein
MLDTKCTCRGMHRDRLCGERQATILRYSLDHNEALTDRLEKLEQYPDSVV